MLKANNTSWFYFKFFSEFGHQLAWRTLVGTAITSRCPVDLHLPSPTNMAGPLIMLHCSPHPAPAPVGSLLGLVVLSGFCTSVPTPGTHFPGLPCSARHLRSIFTCQPCVEACLNNPGLNSKRLYSYPLACPTLGLTLALITLTTF